jgi:hypothetical protein
MRCCIIPIAAHRPTRLRRTGTIPSTASIFLTQRGRDKLVAWLKYLENCSAKHDPSEPMANYDFAWLWAKLGVTDLRC